MAALMIVVLLLACVALLVWSGSRPDELDQLDDPVAASASDNSRSPSFAVRVIMPRLGLPLGGILPDFLVRKLGGTPSELRFDQAIPPTAFELRAEGGWNLFIEINGNGQVAPGTRLVFPIGLGGRQMKLRCRPADPVIGHFHTTPRAGSEEIGGRFIIELATCENADSGKVIEWPPAPLTIQGSFHGLSHRRP